MASIQTIGELRAFISNMPDHVRLLSEGADCGGYDVMRSYDVHVEETGGALHISADDTDGFDGYKPPPALAGRPSLAELAAAGAELAARYWPPASN